MAICKDSPLRFIQTLNNSFYFEKTECVSSSASPETDTFRRMPNTKSCWIQSMNQKFLVLKTKGNFEFEDRTAHDQGQSDCKFNIQIYQDSIPEHSQSVMLYVCIDDQKMMISCTNNKEVFPKPMDPNSLNIIKDTKHEALFRWKKISNGRYKFESTMHTGYFLAFEAVEDLPCLFKLILRREPQDEVDESLLLGVSYCK